MLIEDPRLAPQSRHLTWAIPFLNDSRDTVFVSLMLQCSCFAALGVGLFALGPRALWVAPLYWALCFGLLLDRFTLMLHCVSHRPLFKPKYRLLNQAVFWLIGPFFGQTPNTYFAHHLGMHHLEENLGGDLSSTMRYRRDSLRHFAHYWLTFLFLGLAQLSRYLLARKRYRLLRRMVLGELSYFACLGALLYLAPIPTLVVFVFPLVAIRTLMMMGNWGQHAFIAPDAPDNPYTASITCINTRYNRRCFNDGYHIGHHIKSRAHWTEYPDELEKNLPKYIENGAIVFEGIDFFMVWLLLMTGRWERLARAYVQLPGAPQRSRAEIIALLRTRVQPFDEPSRARTPAMSAGAA